MKKQILAVSAALLVALSSCNKDNDKDNVQAPKPKTKSELLTEKVWDLKQIHVISKVQGHVIFDQIMPMTGTVEFKTDNTVVSTQPEEPVEVSTWELKGDTLFVDDQAGYILELTQGKLRLLQEFTEFDSAMGNIDVQSEILMTR